MNHALICKNYYRDDIESSPWPAEVKKLQLYFTALKARDWYYNAMKYHAVHLIKDMLPGVTLKEIAKIINVDHSTVIHYFKRYTPMNGHRMFISQYFEKFVENQIYPLKPKNSKDLKQYGAFKPTTLEEAKLYYKEPAARKKPEKKKGKYTSQKNPQEKY